MKSDVVVVGGGAVGLSCAWYLSEAGLMVTLVSRDPVGTGASAGNAGMIVPSHMIPLSAPGVIAQGLRWLARPESPFYVRPRLDADLARWLFRFRASCTDAHVAYAAPALAGLAVASAGLHADLHEALGGFGWKRTGLLVVYRSDRHRRDAGRAADLAERYGLSVRRLDAGGLREVEPGLRSDATGAVLYEDDGRIDPEAFLAKMRGRLVERGVVLREGAGIRALPTEGASVDLASGERLQAGRIVVAAGAWTGRLVSGIGVRLPVQPAKGYSITVPERADGPRIPIILSEDRITITPMPGRIRFGGTLALDGFDPSIDARRYAPIRAQALRYHPDLTDDEIGVERAWSGFRPASPDGLPMIGALKGRPEVVVATGHGTMGITLAPATGRLVADLVTGSSPLVDPVPFDPARF